MCDCGREIILSVRALLSGTKYSCGCGMIPNNRYEDRELAILNMSYIDLKKRNGNLDFYQIIPFEEFKKISFENCFYCGLEPNKKIIDQNKKDSGEFIIINGIDRIDSNRGYECGNVRPCCKNCNFAKNSLTEEEFANLICRIVSNLKIF